MREPPDEWLERINSELGTKGISHKQRPWLAWSEWAKESGQSLTLSDPAVRRIFEWFKKNSKSDSHQPRVTVLPDVNERYQSKQWPVVTLWNGYMVALHTAATVLRLLTGEDARKALRQ